VINEWGFLTRDVLGIGNPSITNAKAFKKVVSLVAATTLMNMFFEDVLNITSPFPAPVRAFQDALEEGDEIPSASFKAARELAEQVPLVGGSVRYGSAFGGPIVEIGKDVNELIAQKPWAKPWLVTAGKVAGVPGTQQIAKSVRAKKRGGTVTDIALGRYVEEPKGGVGPRLKRVKLRPRGRLKTRAIGRGIEK
jgi:hypothetical protein